MDVLRVWKSLASNEMKQLTHPYVLMGADVCYASTSQGKDKKLEPDVEIGKATNIPCRSIQKAMQNHEQSSLGEVN